MENAEDDEYHVMEEDYDGREQSNQYEDGEDEEGVDPIGEDSLEEAGSEK